MTSKKRGLRWLELAEKRDKLEGTRIISLVRQLGTSEYILNKNYQEVMGVIEAYEEDVSIWSVKNRDKLKALQIEFLRLLHNYLASIKSLIDHTRVVKNELNNDAFDKYYEPRKNELINHGCIRFLQDLRNYTQHKKLPIVYANLSSKKKDSKEEKEAINQRLILKKDDLLEWDGWCSKSKEYINGCEEEINIKNVLKSYQKIISTFYKKVHKKIENLYSEEIKELYNLEQKMKKNRIRI